jgi:hypothetical protein
VPWYLGPVTLSSAEQFVDERPDGFFVICDSPDGNSFILFYR